MHTFWLFAIGESAALALGYALRGSHINQAAEDHLRELYTRLDLAIRRDESGLRSDVTGVVNELDAIVHRIV